MVTSTTKPILRLSKWCWNRDQRWMNSIVVSRWWCWSRRCGPVFSFSSSLRTATTRPTSTLLSPPPPPPFSIQQQRQWLSTTSVQQGPDAAVVVFKYPKAEALFMKITSTLTSEQVLQVADEINNNILCRPIRKNEFYYDGFGSRRRSSSSRQGGDDDEDVDDSVKAAAVELPTKTTFDLKLVGFDVASKIKVIKEVRAIAGLGLKESKELVESTPAVIQKGLKEDQAADLKSKLEAVGAQIELV